MCFFSFCIKSAKRDKNSNSVQILCLFFTVCLKAQKSFNYYIIKMKSKLAFVILRIFFIQIRPRSLSFAMSFVSLQVLPIFFRSYFSTLRHAFFGLPTFCCPCGFHWNLWSFVFASLKCVLNCSICVFWLLFLVVADWSFSISLRCYWYPVILSNGCFLCTCSQRPDLKREREKPFSKNF